MSASPLPLPFSLFDWSARVWSRHFLNEIKKKEKKLLKLVLGAMHFYSSKDILNSLIEVGDTLNGPTTPMMKKYFIAIIQSSMNSRHNGTFISYPNGIKFYTRRSDALKVNQMPFENQITRLIRIICTLCSHLLLSLCPSLSHMCFVGTVWVPSF